MTIEEKANIILNDYRLRAENDYLNALNDIYIERINKAIEYIQDNYLFDIEYHEDGDFNRISCKQQKIDLLKILRGVDIHSVERTLEQLDKLSIKGDKE